MAEAPCEVWFYHLERQALDQVLPRLLEQALDKSWRALVRTREPDRLAHLDSWLWSFRDDSFLPHGLAGEPQAARQPVLLTAGFDNSNAANALYLVDGAELGELAGFTRCAVLFDEPGVDAARAQLLEARGRGLPTAYWRQKGRGWEKQA